MSRTQRTLSSPTAEGQIRDRWKRIGAITHRAGDDDTDSETDLQGLGEEDRVKVKERKRRQKKEREKYAKVMGLEYFLEMVRMI